MKQSTTAPTPIPRGNNLGNYGNNNRGASSSNNNNSNNQRYGTTGGTRVGAGSHETSNSNTGTTGTGEERSRASTGSDVTAEPDKTSVHTSDAGEDHAQSSRSNTQGTTHARQEVSSNRAETTQDGSTTQHASTDTYTHRDETRDNPRDYTSGSTRTSQQTRGTPNRNRSDISNRNTNDVISPSETSIELQTADELSLLSNSSSASSAIFESNVTLNSTLEGSGGVLDNCTGGTSNGSMVGNTGRKLFTVVDQGITVRRKHLFMNQNIWSTFTQKYRKSEKFDVMVTPIGIRSH